MRRICSLLLITLLCLLGCQQPPANPGVSQTPGPELTPGGPEPTDSPLKIVLRDGSPPQQKSAVSKTVEGTPLDEAETRRLLDKFGQPLPQAERAEFSKRPDSPPPPRAEVVKPLETTTPEAPPRTARRALQVLSVAPQGEVKNAGRVSFSFSSPMVAVSDPQELKDPPFGITLKPQPAGTWRWLGTQTLVFEPEGKQMPRATRYTVTVPKGVQDVNGNPLGETLTQNFSLAPPQGLQMSVSDRGLSPYVRLRFSQPVNPQGKVQLWDGSSQTPMERVEAPEKVEAAPGTVHWYRPKRELKSGTTYQVRVTPGVPSLEGPLTSTAAWETEFSTYQGLKLARRWPERGKETEPGRELHLMFNNELDFKTLEPGLFSVEPPLEDMEVGWDSNHLFISGNTKARTTYRVTISDQLTDVYGQKLDKPIEVEFKIGGASRELHSRFDDLTVLNPQLPPKIPLYTTNVKKLEVQIAKVQPQDWERFLKYDAQRSRNRLEGLAPPSIPGKVVRHDTLELKEKTDSIHRTELDLSPYLKDGVGNLILTVRDPDERSKWPDRAFSTWIQVTRAGLDLTVDHEKAVAVVTRLKDGAPLPQARVKLGKSGGTTDESGTVTFPLPKTSGPICLATSELGEVFLPENSWSRSEWKRSSLTPTHQWFLFNDRGLYKPGESVQVKGYLRWWARGPQGQLQANEAGQTVDWVLRGPLGNEVLKGQSVLDESSALDLTLALPDEINLGEHRLVLSGAKVPGGHLNIKIEEFRRPEFEVKVEPIDPAVPLLQDTSTVKGAALYYSGGGLAGSEMEWSVRSKPAQYSPPGRGDYSFGRSRPWWQRSPLYASYSRDSQTTKHIGVTDGSGAHLLELEFQSMHPPGPVNVTVSATVTDVDRQRHKGSTELLVHPCERYVGLKASQNFVDGDSDFEIAALVTDIEGRTLPGVPVLIKLLRLETGRNQETVETLISQQTVTSEESEVVLKLSPEQGGRYLVRADVMDRSARMNRTEISLWKSGSPAVPSGTLEQQSLTLVPAGKNFEPGQTARVLVLAPFSEGQGVVVWTRDGIESHQSFTLKNGSATLEKTITEEMLPQLDAVVTCVGSDSGRPAFALGSLQLPLSLDSRRLDVELGELPHPLAPGAEAEVQVKVKDHKGKPVEGSQVALWIVDEAVLGMVGYTTPDPLAAFYRRDYSEPSSTHFRNSLFLDRPVSKATDGLLSVRFGRGRILVTDDIDAGADFSPYRNYNSLAGTLNFPQYNGVVGLIEGGDGFGPPFSDAYGFDVDGRTSRGLLGFNIQVGDQVRGDAEWAHSDYLPDAPKAFTVRSNFAALACFQAKLKTDKNGHTRVKVKLPDNLTRYRIMAVAASGKDRFGSTEQALTARLPLQVRPSLPRFLNFGDKATLPVIVQNQTDQPMSVKVVGEAQGVSWLGGQGKTVEVPAQDRVEVRFEARADSVGQAHFRFAVESGEHQDASTLTLPVHTPSSSEAFATYGSLNEEKAVKHLVKQPADVWTQFGGLRVSLSSTALSELSDAFLYLYEYKFECAEQRASRLLGITTLGEVLAEFNPASMPSKQALQSQANTDLEHLSRMQNSDGGWQYWRRENRSDPFVSIHVAHALARAPQAPESAKKSALSFLREIEKACRAREYSARSTRSAQAYALFVRNLLKDPDPKQAKALFPKLQKDNGLEGLGWLWPTLAQHAPHSAELQELRRFVLNRVTQTAEKAQFTTSTSEGDGSYLLHHSSRRTDAILLAGLLVDQPDSPLNRKLVRGLLGHRVKGRWNNTQENIWVLLALRAYFEAYEKDGPNFEGRLWLGEDMLGRERFQGRSAKVAQVHIPMAQIPSTQTALVLAKEGKGRLYYRVGMKSAPQNLRLEASSQGFTVERTFRGLDNESDVRQDENGNWHIKAGSKIEVKLTLVAPERRHHVALVDPLAAGMEALNPTLEGTPTTSHGGARQDWWWGPWYDHDNLRDERVEAFANLLHPGVYTYRYTALATTPGEFILPPAKAEEMYSPEVFGRTSSGRLLVEEG